MRAMILLASLLLPCARPAAAQEPEREPFRWYVCLHTGQLGHAPERLEPALRAARDLGFMGVRTDAFWFDLEPRAGAWSDEHLERLAAFVEQSRRHGLDPLIILCGAPGWALELLRDDPDAFFDAFERYAARVVARLGPRVDRWQLWNEGNHPLLTAVPRDRTWRLFERAGRAVRAHDVGATTLVNVLIDLPGWRRQLDGWLARAGDAIDVVGIDHYPGTWSWRAPDAWEALRDLLARAERPGDRLHGKGVAVLETGFSTWPPHVAGEGGQRAWIEKALPALRAIAVDSRKDGRRGLVLGSFYQLLDEPGRPGQEAEFGVLRADLTPKAGAEALRRELASFREHVR